VVTLEDIYRNFNGGIVNPHAIEDFLAYAADKWKEPPVYVALVGKGSLDHKDVQELGGNLFPILQTNTPWGLHACDTCYGDLDDDGVSEFSIGRIPALSAEELDQYLIKLEAYESQAYPDWANDLLFSADNFDAAGNFGADSDYLAGLIPGGFPTHTAYLDTQTSTQVNAALMDGFGSRGLVNWIGHGSWSSLADPSVLQLDDIVGTGEPLDPGYKPGMNNGNSLPLFAALTCQAGRFEVPGQPSLSEALVLRAGGGAIAAYSPTGLSRNDHAVILNEGLLRSLYLDGQPRIGDAARDAQLFYKEHPHVRFMLNIYSVTGDPATILY